MVCDPIVTSINSVFANETLDDSGCDDTERTYTNDHRKYGDDATTERDWIHVAVANC
jgi:predicted esterase